MENNNARLTAIFQDNQLPGKPVLECLHCGYYQCCDLETMVSRLDCTRVHFV